MIHGSGTEAPPIAEAFALYNAFYDRYGLSPFDPFAYVTAAFTDGLDGHARHSEVNALWETTDYRNAIADSNNGY